MDSFQSQSCSQPLQEPVLDSTDASQANPDNMDTTIAAVSQLKKSTTFILDEDYFQQDKMIMDKTHRRRTYLANYGDKVDYCQINEVYFAFKPTVFVEYFIYHFFFFFVFGPLVVVPITVFRGLPLAYNLCFLGRDSVFMYQLTFYFFTQVFMITYFLNQDFTAVPPVYMYMLISSMLLRIFIIAVKYAYMNKEKLELRQKMKLSTKDLHSDQAFDSWYRQDCEIIKAEIRSTVKRHEIDYSLLFLDFAVEPDSLTSKRLHERGELMLDFLVQTEKKMNNLKELRTQSQRQLSQKFFGLSILCDLVFHYQEKSKSKRKFIIVVIFIVAAIKVILPLIITYVHYSKSSGVTLGPADGDTVTVVDVMLNVTFCLSTFWLYSINLAFFYLSYVDIQRKLYFVKQLTFVIAPRKVNEYAGRKMYPTLNLFDPISLKTWSVVRRLSLDYGRKYDARLQMGVTCQLVFYSIVGVVLLLEIIFRVEVVTNPATMVVLGVEFLVLVAVTLKMLIGGAYINDHFRIQKGVFKEIRTIYCDLQRLKNVYFDSQIVPKNYLYQYCIEKIQEEFKGVSKEEFLARVEEYLGNLIVVMEDILSELYYDEENNPYTLFGLNATISLFKKVLLGLGSVSITALQRFLVSEVD